MGNYLTNADVITRVGNKTAAELTTDSGSTPDTALIDQYIDEAEGEIDSYLSRRTKVPIDLVAHPEVAAPLRGKVMAVVIYMMQSRRSDAPDDVRKQRDDAIDWATKISEGKALLPATLTPAPTTSDEPGAKWKSSPPNASRETIV